MMNRAPWCPTVARPIYGGAAAVIVFAWLFGTVATRLLVMAGAGGFAGGMLGDMLKAGVHLGIGCVLFTVGWRCGACTAAFQTMGNDILLLLFWATQLLSSVMSTEPIMSICLVGVLFIVFVNAELLMAIARESALRTGIAGFGLVGSVLSLGMSLALFAESRSTYNTLNANSTGALAVLAGSLGLAYQRTYLRVIVLGIAAAAVIIVESRAALLGLAVGAGLFLFLSSRQRFAAALAGILMLGTILLGFPATEKVLAGAWARVMRLDDPHRGVDSGLSGRADLWALSWELFEEKPLLGTGPRTQGHYDVPDWYGSHNGYLATLLEVGFIGAVPAFALLLRALRDSLRFRDDPVSRVLLVAATTFMVRAFFENELFNNVTDSTVALVLWLRYSRHLAQMSRVSLADTWRMPMDEHAMDAVEGSL